MTKSRIGLKSDIGESQSDYFKNQDISNLEDKVRFSLRYCDTHTYCITKLGKNKQYVKRLYSTLGKFEDMTWQ